MDIALENYVYRNAQDYRLYKKQMNAYISRLAQFLGVVQEAYLTHGELGLITSRGDKFSLNIEVDDVLFLPYLKPWFLSFGWVADYSYIPLNNSVSLFCRIKPERKRTFGVGYQRFVSVFINALPNRDRCIKAFSGTGKSYAIENDKF
jgi:hypothetical protein